MRVAGGHAELIAQAFHSLIEHGALGLSPEQRVVARQAARRALLSVVAPEPE